MPVIWWPKVGASGSVVLKVQPILAERRGVHNNAAPGAGSKMWTRERGEQEYISSAAICARVAECT